MTEWRSISMAKTTDSAAYPDGDRYLGSTLEYSLNLLLIKQLFHDIFLKILSIIYIMRVLAARPRLTPPAAARNADPPRPGDRGSHLAPKEHS